MIPRRIRSRPSTFERRKIMEIVEKHGAMTVEQLAMQRGRGVSSTHQHVRILADLGYLEESPYTIVPDPLRPGRVLRLARTFPGLTIPEIAADTGRSHDEVKVALDDLGAREEIATRTWRLP